ncbi:hypothetical protein SUGI_0711990 [Cryptomeria japonica]|nr:hypothetical protein SUGI_0711990 [Cryptomeria japonica]
MESDQQNLTLDGSVDVRGKPAVIAKTGGWRACYETVERMAFAAIWANLFVYLTKKLHEGTVSSSRKVTNLIGTLWLTPLLGAYVADTNLGRFRTFAVFSIIYIVTFLVYVEDHIGWGVAFGIIITGLIVSYVVFMVGTPIYRYKAVSGSPLQRMAKVIVRTIQN